MTEIQIRSSRAAGRSRRTAPEHRVKPPRTLVALSALGLTLMVFAVAVGPRLIGPIGGGADPTPEQGAADRDTEFLRGLSLDQLRLEKKKRAAAVNRLINTPAPPRDQLAAARDAAYRASAVVAEKDPKNR